MVFSETGEWADLNRRRAISANADPVTKRARAGSHFRALWLQPLSSRDHGCDGASQDQLRFRPQMHDFSTAFKTRSAVLRALAGLAPVIRRPTLIE